MNKDKKHLKVCKIQRGMIRAESPSTPRPAPPKGQSPFSTLLDATKLISAFCAQFPRCLNCPLDVSNAILPGGMASPTRCLLFDIPSDWNHDLIKDRLEKRIAQGI